MAEDTKAPEAVPMLTDEEKEAALAKVVPDIERAFTEAIAKGQQPEPPPPDPVQMMADAFERTVELYREDARLFPNHRGLEPGEGSGRA